MIDRRQLLKDAPRLEKTIPRGVAKTGATEAVSTALPEILQLRSEGVRWAAIAAALAKQGLVEGPDKRPLSTRRLTALVSQIVARDRARADRARARTLRPDLVVTMPATKPLLTLAPELTTSKQAEHTEITEEQIRRENLSAIQHLLKPAAKEE